MTVLDHELHLRPHLNLRLLFAILAMAGVILFLAFGPIGSNGTETAVGPATCATDAPGCEMNWLQQNLTEIEHPILILPPETR